jgi:hypothetical protein
VLPSPRTPSCWLLFALCCAPVALFSCKAADPPATSSYFEREVSPILEHSCSRQTAGCHMEDARGSALGNLDTTTFERLSRRRDLLETYGPYAMPGLLTKVIGPQSLTIQTLDGPIVIRTDIRHAAGAGLDITSDGFATLKRWMDNGATKQNTGNGGPVIKPGGACRKTHPVDVNFDATKIADSDPGYSAFSSKVAPWVVGACATANCHGGPLADLAITCGDDDEQKKWNWYISAQYVTGPAEDSEIVRRPLAPAAGGSYHGGGAIFDSTGDEHYKAILDWAKTQGPAKVAPEEQGLQFFANYVQPILARKGCLFQGCHSPLMFHEYELRGGSGGRFSVATTRRNYAKSVGMMSFESPDPNMSRLIAKNLFPFDRSIDPGGLGIFHRGGALLDDVPGVDRAIPSACAGIDVEGAKDLVARGEKLSTIPSYCVLVAWHAKERSLAIAKGPAAKGIAKDPISGIVYVSRPADTDVPQAFDTYRPGASLHLVASARLDADGNVDMGADDRDVTTTCGLTSSSADIRRPTVSWDGSTIAFAARTSATTPLAMYTMKADGTGCAMHPLSSSTAHPPIDKGILLHDFDPAYGPDGRMVFASTRGAIGQSDVDYSGPTRTPNGLLPNANLYLLEKDGTTVRQMTFLNGQEIAPSFKRNGQFIFTTEKRAPGFYQLAARRQNVDGSDYHPLYGQRKSIGFTQLVDVRHLSDGNIVGIFSDLGAKGRGGALGVINRSLGPDQFDRDPTDRFFLHSLSFPDPTTTGKKGASGSIYRSPSPLPARSVLVSFATGDPFTFDGAYELVQVDVRNGTRRPLVKVAGQSIVDAVAIYTRQNAAIFKPDPNNFTVDATAGVKDAVLRSVDLPMIAALMFDNRRGPRKLEVAARWLGILESLPAPPEVTSFDAADAKFVTSDEYGTMWIKRRRIGLAPTFDDGSVALHIPGGMPFVQELYDNKDNPAYVTQLEEVQLYPGERAKGSFRNPLFGANCGGCHGAVNGKETDVHLQPDVITEASRATAITGPLAELAPAPASRGTLFGK